MAHRTESLRVLARAKLDRSDTPPHWRPRTRGECCQLPRPCPYVGCRYHLMLDTTVRDALAWVADDVERMPQTCALDVASGEAMTLEDIGNLMGMTRERVRQLEAVAVEKLRAYCEAQGLRALEGMLDCDYAAPSELENNPTPPKAVFAALGLEEESAWLKKHWSP